MIGRRGAELSSQVVKMEAGKTPRGFYMLLTARPSPPSAYACLSAINCNDDEAIVVVSFNHCSTSTPRGASA